MKYFNKVGTIVICSLFIAFNPSISDEHEPGIDTAKNYALELPKLMMSSKKNKKLIVNALNKIENECCSKNLPSKDKNRVKKIKKSLEKCLTNKCHSKTYLMWAIKRPRKLIVLNQIDELNAIFLKNEQANLLDTKTREDILLKEKNDAKGDYEKLLVTYNKLEEDNQELKTAIANLLKEYNLQIKKLEDNNSTLEKYISDLSKQNSELSKQNSELSKQNSELKEELEKLKSALPAYLKRQLKIEN
tara:strand:+ start:111 stop:848 length:738 start_codon:yes stop_codon:yes gene_type:complete